MATPPSTQPHGNWHWHAPSQRLVIDAPKATVLSELTGEWSIDAFEQMLEGLSRGRLAKAFGTGIGAEIGWRSVSVSRQASGAPVVKLDEQAAAQLKAMGGEQVLLSLSHLSEIAAAFAVITR